MLEELTLLIAPRTRRDERQRNENQLSLLTQAGVYGFNAERDNWTVRTFDITQFRGLRSVISWALISSLGFGSQFLLVVPAGARSMPIIPLALRERLRLLR